MDNILATTEPEIPLGGASTRAAKNPSTSTSKKVAATARAKATAIITPIPTSELLEATDAILAASMATGVVRHGEILGEQDLLDLESGKDAKST